MTVVDQLDVEQDAHAKNSPLKETARERTQAPPEKGSKGQGRLLSEGLCGADLSKEGTRSTVRCRSEGTQSKEKGEKVVGETAEKERRRKESGARGGKRRNGEIEERKEAAEFGVFGRS